MTLVPEPPDLDPTEEPIVELSALIPEPDDDFTAEVGRRLDQHALAKNVTVAGVWMSLAAIVQLVTAVCTLFGLSAMADRPEAEEE